MSASHNDFEDALPELCPDSVAAMEELRVRGALAAHLCGSGSAAFGFAASPDAAEVIAASLRGRWPWVSVCRTVGAAETRSL
jgi:4-diphosphocytidyl-2C-methyl-D-erythritol kinase